ncbi:2-isopropylmalate synthase [compost metagenome]
MQTPDGSLQLCGEGEGAITALVNGWERQTGMHIDVLDYSEHALSAGTGSRAAAYVLLSVDGTRMCGVAIGRDVVNASLQAVINGAAQIRALRQSA